MDEQGTPHTNGRALRDALEGAHAVVTGGAGFIGGHLVDALLAHGARVSVIDDLSSSDASHLARVLERDPDRVRFLQGSILDPIALGAAVEGARFVFHLAAVCSVPRSVRDPARSWVVNATGTMRVLVAAHKSGAARVIFSASSSAYGDAATLPKTEHMPPLPSSPYAASKLAGEALCRAWSASYGIDTVSLRYFNIFGPRQSADSAYAAVIPAFARALLSREAPVIFGDGEQTRDFTHVDNAVHANLLAAAAPQPLGGAVLNIGSGASTSIHDIASRLPRLLGVDPIEPVHEPPRPGDVRDSLASIERARDTLGYEVVTPFAEGLEHAAAWYRSHLAPRGVDRANRAR